MMTNANIMYDNKIYELSGAYTVHKLTDLYEVFN